MMKQQLKPTLLLAGLLIGLFSIVAPAYTSAHVTVKPATATTGSFQTFTTNVPNEKNIPVSGVRLVVPSGLNYVTPTVKPGWEVQTKKTGDTITEISWTGGQIAAGLRDEFTFAAQVPAKPGDVVWKAYQTYQDGSVVSWDQKPSDDHGHESRDESKGPYSVTKVTEETTATKVSQTENDTTATLSLVLASIAAVLSVAALAKVIKQ